MNTVLKIFLSLSFSGSLLILALLLGKRLFRDKISRQWQYYIWLVVVLRLLLPFGPEADLLGGIYQAVDQAIAQAAALPEQHTPMGQRQPGPNALGDDAAPADGLVQGHENADSLDSSDSPDSLYSPDNLDSSDSPGSLDISAEGLAAVHPLRDMGRLLRDHIWLAWLVPALGLLICKITVYQSFLHYIHVGLAPVSDMEMLNRLSIAAERAGVKGTVELCVNPLISSPMLIGFFRPCIVLPGADSSEKDFQYIILHELIHYKRRDLFYKWLVQLTVCLHWFNPLVHLMSREITRACEFSCDEAVLAKMGESSAQDYGKALLNAMAAVGRYRENTGAVTLSANKRLLKERLEAIMECKGRSKGIKILTAALTLCVVLGAAFIGVYKLGTAAGSAQTVAPSGTPPDVNGMSSDTIEGQQDASEVQPDRSEAQQDAVDTDARPELGRDEASDELEEKQEKEWAEAQTAEYAAAGVTMDGKDYYYQGQLVNIFLDIRADRSFYTLDLNPAGTVNIKIIRDADNKITDVAYMNEAEAGELLEDIGDDEENPDDEDLQETGGGRIWHPHLIPIDLETMAEGEIVWLGDYTLSDGDRLWYAVTAETGNRLQVGFAEPGDESLNEVYHSVSNQRQEDGTLECIASITCRPPAEPVTYRLFLRAPEGALGNVKGSISIGYKAEAEDY